MIASSTVRPRISVSIVVYNSSLALLESTLQSLRCAVAAALSSGLGGVTVTVVDNGSADAYRQQLTALLGTIPKEEGFLLEVLRLPENLGFGAGHNCALRDTSSKYYLVLNPDVELASDALALGFQRLQEDPSVALLSPFAVGTDGNQEYLCKRKPSLLVLLLRAFAPGLGRRVFPGSMTRYEMSDVCSTDAEVVVPLASGCFMLARTADLQRVGGFDERYFLYFEDFDLSLRLSQFGVVLYMPQLRIVHHGGYAASKGWRHLKMFASSGLRFFRQHGWQWI